MQKLQGSLHNSMYTPESVMTNEAWSTLCNENKDNDHFHYVYVCTINIMYNVSTFEIKLELSNFICSTAILMTGRQNSVKLEGMHQNN